MDDLPGISSDSIDLDLQLAQADLNKLVAAGGNSVLESGPFYNCFYSRFRGVEDSGSNDGQE